MTNNPDKETFNFDDVISLLNFTNTRIEAIKTFNINDIVSILNFTETRRKGVETYSILTVHIILHDPIRDLEVVGILHSIKDADAYNAVIEKYKKCEISTDPLCHHQTIRKLRKSIGI